MKRFFWLCIAIQTSLLAVYGFTNPILPYDYSDPDVIRFGKTYYMTYSTFACTPGLQILQSDNGVQWKVVDAVLPDTIPGYGHLDACPAGCGVWAPSLRFNQGRFYIYYGDPDIGIYCIRSEKTETIPCRWEPAVLVKRGKGLIDPCPLWDTDGRCYLVHAFAGSRAGFKSALAVCELAADGLSVIKDDELIFDGHPDHPTCEGPKFYKRNSYYYIFCPAGGVKSGWQLCLRAKSPYGPYECQRVLEQGTTSVNGPHQGAWVDNYFWHFQDVGAAGRIVHLQPLTWRKGWPVIGDDGQPVKEVKGIADVPFVMTNELTDWQWSGNRRAQYIFGQPDAKSFRLFTYPSEEVQTAPNLLLHKIPAATGFTFEARLRFTPNHRNSDHEQAGIIVHGRLSRLLPIPGDGQWYYARVVVSDTQLCRFYLSRDGRSWELQGEPFQAVAGEWIGAKIGFYATRDHHPINDSGYLDVEGVSFGNVTRHP